MIIFAMLLGFCVADQFLNAYRHRVSEYRFSGAPVILISNWQMTIYIPTAVTLSLQLSSFNAQSNLDKEFAASVNSCIPTSKREYSLETRLISLLKNISHIPLLISLTEHSQSLQKYVESYLLTGDYYGSNESQLSQDVKLILKACLSNIKIKTALYTPEIKRALANLSLMARELAINRLQELVQELDTLYSSRGLNWLQGAKIIVSTSHFDHDGNWAVEYFSSLGARNGCSSKIVPAGWVGSVYSTVGQIDDEAIRDFIGRHSINAKLGLWVFGSACRMHQDVLSE